MTLIFYTRSAVIIVAHAIRSTAFKALLLFVTLPSYAQPPPIQLATHYRNDINIEQYYVSEKLDGVRAYWDGEKLISKQGNTFTAPIWFTNDFPNTPLDGELWTQRQDFESVSGIVRTRDHNNPLWQSIKFMIFDLPHAHGPFEDRITAMRELLNGSKSIYLHLIEQQRVESLEALYILLDRTVKEQGEGLILHHQDALYKSSRTQHLMKLKKFYDAEATVIGHHAGKGKYEGMLGSLVVQSENGIIFKIGTGFSDEERQNPPDIGSIVTYRYSGKTRNNIPRFAAFMREKVIF